MKKPFLIAGLGLLVFTLTLAWPHLTWPAAQSAYFTLEKGELKLVPQVELPYTSILPVETGVVFSTEELMPFESTVKTLLSSGLTVNVENQDFEFLPQMKDLLLEKQNGEVQLGFSPDFEEYMLSTLEASVNVVPTNIHLLEGDESKPSKVKMEGTAMDGKELIRPLTLNLITAAVNKGSTKAQGLVHAVRGKIVNETGKDLGPLQYLGEGRSSFWGSSPEREFNIRKALNERFNGILIPPGEEFSYVEFLGPIEYAGWKRALAIFKGTQLEPTPAGGVCQVSTTVYRAVLDAALQITEHRSHSLYVIYYQHFGDGLDATVFPGEQDFKFVNNTGNYLLMVAQEEGYKEAVIRFYGQDDGRSTQLYGPYTASNQTEESQGALGNLGGGQIAWKYLITHEDGTTETKWLLSDYMSPALQHRGEAPSLLEN